MGTAILSSFSQTLYFIFFSFFLFFFSFFKLIDNMEAKSDFDTLVFKAELEAELENIASGLRRLIGEDIVPHLHDEVECFNVDSPPLGESFPATSSSSGESMKRLFEEEAYHLLQWLFKFSGKLYNCPEEEDADDVSDDVAEEKGNVRDFLDYFFVFITLFVAMGIALY